jgi:hypothetical protein
MAMTACSEWREALIDHALGQPASAALEAHLPACTGCSQALETWRQKTAELDAAVQQRSAAEPRAYGAERVLARIRQVQTARPSFGRIALAALILAVCLVVVLYRRNRPEKHLPFSEMALSAWRSPTQSLLHSPADPLLRTVPHLGESFFEMKSRGHQHAQ